MTVIPEHVVRLLETTNLMLLDPMAGPVPRQVSSLALGDEVLVVADGRMCFRPLVACQEAAPPSQIVQLAASTLAVEVPRTTISLDSRQPVGAPVLNAKMAAVGNIAPAWAPGAQHFWFDIEVASASHVIADNLSVATGPLVPMATDAVYGTSSSPTAEVVVHAVTSAPLLELPKIEEAPILRAFSGPLALPLSELVAPASRMVFRFVLPPRTTTLRLVSASALPPGDGRKLGVAVFRLAIENIEIPLDSPSLVRGFHRAESGEGMTWRWTDGEALLIMPPKPVPQHLTVHITDWHTLLTAG